MTRALGLLLSVSLLAGCATYKGGAGPGPFGDITKLAVTDLQAALADATAHNDLPAMQCYPVLIQVVQSLPTTSPLKEVYGPVSAFQAARDLSKAIQANVGRSALVQTVNLGCAALFNDVQGDILRLGIKFRP